MAKRKRGRGVVRFRKENKKFVTDYYDNRGKRHIETIGEDREDAEKALTERMHELDTGTFDFEKKEKDFKNYALGWIERKRNVKESSLKSYRGHLENHLIPYFGKIRMHEITRENIHELIKCVMDKGRSAKTVHNVLATFHQILLDATVDGYVEKSPYIRINKPRKEKTDIDILDIKEIYLLYDALLEKRDRFYLLFKTAIETGLRRGELFGLQWEDFNWIDNQVFVRRSYVKGKLITPKSKTSVRRVYLNSELANELKAYRGLKDLKEGAFVFCHENGEPLDACNVIKRHFKPALRKAGLRSIRFHDLRHTNVAVRLAAGQDAKYISEQLGHSTIQITMDVYGHLMPTHRKEQEKRLEAYLNGNITVTERPLMKPNT